jgi:hypothetical protein
MISYEHTILIILIVIVILILIFYRKRTKVYYFIDKKDKKSLKKLKKILKKTSNEVILVIGKDNDNEVKNIIKELNDIRPIKKILNRESFRDMTEIAFESCFRNAKCMNQPHDRFYAIVNRLNVFGYPFDYDNKITTPSDAPSDNGMAAVPQDKLSRKYTDVPKCGRRRSSVERDV